ncbi:MAG TPA: alpha/beta hydrolase [Roseomonas sp.]|jgi:putative redox protein
MIGHAFDFTGPRGYRLSGRLEEPEIPPRGWAMLAHCFTCGKDSLATTRLARALASHGIGVLRFDFAGLGTSGGSFAATSFAADVDDLVAAGDAMAAAGKAPSLLVGHSLGGAAALMAAGRMPGIRAVATIGAPFDVAHLLHQFDPASLDTIAARGEAEVLLAGRPFVVRQSFIEDLRRHDLAAAIAALHRPLLILHSPRDATVGIDNAARIFTAAKHPKSFIALDEADHLLTRRADADYAAAMITTWATRYLPADRAAAASPGAAPAPPRSSDG